MMAKKNRLKADALDAPQTREQVQGLIKSLGDNQREMARVEAAMNDRIAIIADEHTPIVNELKDKIKQQLTAIQVWCEANRAEILADGKAKNINLLTGKVSWRTRPPSVHLTKVAVVLESLHTLGLTRFIRTKDEINKDAMLAEPGVASAITGVSIRTGIEDFIVEPFEQEV